MSYKKDELLMLLEGSLRFISENGDKNEAIVRRILENQHIPTQSLFPGKDYTHSYGNIKWYSYSTNETRERFINANCKSYLKEKTNPCDRNLIISVSMMILSPVPVSVKDIERELIIRGHSHINVRPRLWGWIVKRLIAGKKIGFEVVYLESYEGEKYYVA